MMIKLIRYIMVHDCIGMHQKHACTKSTWKIAIHVIATQIQMLQLQYLPLLSMQDVKTFMNKHSHANNA